MSLNNRHSRFRDAEWYGEELDIIIIGAGGIGSWLSMLLSRTNNHNLYIYDFDNVDEVNFAGQLFRTSDLNQPKTQALMNVIVDFCSNHNVYPHGKYTETSNSNNIVFLAADNMAARKLGYEKWRDLMLEDESPEEYLLVDGRLLAEQYQVYHVTSSNYKQYEATLFDDSEVEDVACSYKQTSHFAAMIAARMVQGFTNWLANQNGDDRELPFSVKEYGQLYLIEQE